jgi:hypothetical protein
MKRGETLGFDVESFSSSACTHSVRLSHSVQSTQAQRQRWEGVIACLTLVHHHTQTYTHLIRKQLVSHLFTITHSHTYTQTHTKTLSGSNLVTGVPPLERRNVRGVPSHVIPAVLTNFLLSVSTFDFGLVSLPRVFRTPEKSNSRNSKRHEYWTRGVEFN